ncbi:hypothetical protein QBC34DRAFT_358287 [Podospora aff. communis PSN243]|uniref:Rhodopsin domain-containing protein n=1 Tax=Podospora aff. communis PSN243 TaxID=3040156 RepID=A0AAV9GE61_9PEZI|nr:hypothetical protein QBC34DRAFT_358287 [Podospora aff. communis PSN243]
MSANSTTAALPDPARASESRGYEVTTVNLVCVIFALVLVVLRIYTRLAIVRKRFWEDAAIAAAMLSILLQFSRVSVTPLDKRLFQGAIAINCLGYAIFIVLRAIRCLPYESQWTPGMPGARCFFPSTWFVFASQAWNMFMDFVILLGPLLVLRHSNAPMLQRVLIGIVLAFGAAACIISIVRMQTLLPSAHSPDPTWDKVPAVIFAIIEINVGIACAAVVTLRPLYRRLRDVFRGPSVNSLSTNGQDTPGRWRPSRRVADDLDLISGETVKASGSESDGAKIELGEGVATKT